MDYLKFQNMWSKIIRMWTSGGGDENKECSSRRLYLVKMFCYPTKSIYNKLGNVDLLIAYTNISATFVLILSLYKEKTKDSVVYTVKKLVPG